VATHVEYDTTHWPLAVLVLPADVSAIDLTRLARSLEAIYARRARFVSITDATAVSKLPDAKARSEIGAWTKSIEAQSKRYLVANALVVPSAVARGVLTAIQWIAPPVVPTTVCATVREGATYVIEHARTSAIEVGGVERFLASHRPRDARSA
jgi:hypothetical protein